MGEIDIGQSFDQRLRRIVADEVARELLGEETRGRRMFREVGEHGLGLAHALVGVGLAQHLHRTGFVPVRIERECIRSVRRTLRQQECAGVGGVGAQDRGRGAPSGQRRGERDDIGLRVAAVHTHGVQLEDLASEVLVEPHLALSAERRVGTDRGVVVEEGEHRGVLRGGGQHVAEFAGGMRTDDLALVRADQDGRRHLGRGNDQMVRPEPHQALLEGPVGAERVAGAGRELCVGHLRRPHDIASEHALDVLGGGLDGCGITLGLQRLEPAVERGTRLAVAVPVRRADLRARRQTLELRGQRAPRLELAEQPAAGVAPCPFDVTRACAHPEPVRRRGCFDGHRPS